MVLQELFWFHMSNITVSRASRTSWDHVLQGDPIKISIWMHHICCFAMQLANSSTYSLESTEISLSDCLLYLFRSASPSPSFSRSPCSSSCWRRSSPRPPSWSPSSASLSSSPWSWTPSGKKEILQHMKCSQLKWKLVTWQPFRKAIDNDTSKILSITLGLQCEAIL